jgi:asparagine N-glycosylation enzyme membrane subunit Stt3
MMRARSVPSLPVPDPRASEAVAGLTTPTSSTGDPRAAATGKGQAGAGFVIAAGAVIALGALVRLVRWREALWGPEVVALDNDSLYHMRRSLDVAAGRGLPTFDPQINWPHGGPVPWAPGFDLLGGAIAWVSGAPDSRAAALAVAAIPVVLGVGVIALAMGLAWLAAPRQVRRPAALAAGILAALVPQAIFCSRFAQTDHHVAEALMVTALAVWAQLGVGGGRGSRYELAGALLGAGSVLFFTGAPIYVALAAAPLVVAALLDRGEAPLVGRGAIGLVAGGALAALASVPMVASHGRAVSFAFPSYLQPALVVLAGTGIALAWIAARFGSLRRRLAALAALVVATSLVAALVPGVAAQVVAGVRGWLLARDPWISTIEEFQPVWRIPGRLSRVRALWGIAGMALPFLAPLAAWASWREARGRALALLFQALAMAGLAVLQIRFGRPAVPVLAAAGGVALAALLARIPVRPVLAHAGAPVLALMVFAGDRAAWAATAAQPLDKGDALVAAAFDLRPLGPGETAPGVLAPWDMGHQVNVLARRPVVANGFGSYLDPEGYEEVRKAYTLAEPDLLAWMERRRIGYVVAGIMTFEGKVLGPGTGAPLTTQDGVGALDAAYLRGVPLSAAILGGSGIPDAGVPNLTRLMPRFASLQTARELPFPVPVLWTFEAVPGARVLGQAPAGARVVLEIPLVERGRRHVWRAWADAGADGRYELKVPLPTGLVQPTLATAPTGQLRANGGAPAVIVIPEAAVRSGSTVEVGRALQ